MIKGLIVYFCYSFFTGLAAYLIIGAAYQRFVAGAKGIDQIPHLSFWQDFGNLQAVSLLFSFEAFSYVSVHDLNLRETELILLDPPKLCKVWVFHANLSAEI